MHWSLSETIALASEHCVHCQGFGMHRGKRGVYRPCECVFRRIFRACYERFQVCVASQAAMPPAPLEWSCHAEGVPPTQGRGEEFIADFCAVSRRALSPEAYTVFRYHFLLAADPVLTGRVLGLDKTSLFRFIYQIERRLGRIFRELEPHSLYPLDEYFGGVVRKSHNRNPGVEAILRTSFPPQSVHADLRQIA